MKLGIHEIRWSFLSFSIVAKLLADSMGCSIDASRLFSWFPEAIADGRNLICAQKSVQFDELTLISCEREIELADQMRTWNRHWLVLVPEGRRRGPQLGSHGNRRWLVGTLVTDR